MLGRKKTRTERAEKRIEEAEFARRVRAGEPVVIATPEPVGRPDPDVVEALADYQRALSAVAESSHLLDPAPEAPMCLKHAWSPPRRHPLQPRPAVVLSCPECLAEFDRKPVGPDVYVATSTSGVYPSRGAAPRLDAAWEAHQDRLESDGAILAGREREERIVAEMDEARRRARGRSLMRGGAQRFENGEVKVWRPPSRPKRRRRFSWTVEA